MPSIASTMAQVVKSLQEDILLEILPAGDF